MKSTTEPIDPVLESLDRRRLRNRRRHLDEQNLHSDHLYPNEHFQVEDNSDHSSHEDRYLRSARRLSEHPEHKVDRSEEISPIRTIRWRPPIRLLWVLAAAIVLVTGYRILVSSSTSTEAVYDSVQTSESSVSLPEDTQLATSLPTPSIPMTAWVHVAGAVHSPGIYELSVNARVAEAITAAGGALEEADLNLINLAAPLTDGSQIYVPRIGENPSEATGAINSNQTDQPETESHPTNQLVNLNTASLEELQTLPRVGPKMAQRIIDFREANGGFNSVAELDAVSGIGEAMMEALTPLVTV